MRRFRSLRSSARLLLLGLAAIGSSCQDSKTGGFVPQIISSASGGTASGLNLEVTVPAGASAMDWTAQFIPGNHPASAPMEFDEIGTSVQLIASPPVTLTMPATVRLSVPPAELTGNMILLVTDGSGTVTAVMPTSTNMTTGVVTFETLVIGTYGMASHTDALVDLEFASATSSLTENAGPHTIPVQAHTLGGVHLGFEVTSTVNITGGTATPFTDLGVTTAQVVFPVGTGDGQFANVALPVLDDGDIEADETVELTLPPSAPLVGVGMQAQHVATILSDETGEFAFDLATSTGGESGTSMINVVLTTTPTSLTLSSAVTVDVAAGGTATDGSDYSLGSTTLTFPIGSVNGATMPVVVNGMSDLTVEGDETLDLTLQNPSVGLTVGSQSTHQLTLTDEDVPMVAFQSANSATADESTTLNVTVELTTTAPLASAVMVDVVDAGGGTATSGTDYTSFPTTTVTFPMGSTNGATMTVALVPTGGDDLVEGPETLSLQLQNPMNGVLGTTTTHGVTITDGDAATVAFTSSASMTSGEGGSLPVSATLTTSPVSATLAGPVTLSIGDALSGTATSGTDYTAIPPNTLTFTAGTGNGATQSVTLTPLADSLVEGAESVDLTLQSLTGMATFGPATTHTVTLTDDDMASVQFVSASSSSADESTPLNVVVSLATSAGAMLAAPVTVDVVDGGGGTATSTTDYNAFGTQTVTFTTGSMSGATQTATLTPLDDSLVESSETVNLTLQNPTGVALLGGQTAHTVTIVEDEAAATLDFMTSTSSVAENAGAGHLVTVTLGATGNLGEAVSVTVSDAGTGSAISGADFTAFSPQVLTFPAGSTPGSTQTVTVTPLDNVNVGDDLSVELSLGSPTGPAMLGPSTAHTVLITEEDTATLEFSLASSSTADETSALTIDVQLTIPAGGRLSLVSLTADVIDLATGSGTSVTDYTAFGTQTVTFASGTLDGETRTVTLTPLADMSVEGPETVALQLQNLGGGAPTASIGSPSTHTVTITDDDAATVAFELASSATVDEATPLNVLVELSLPGGGTLGSAVTVDGVDAMTGSATSGTDYSAFGTQTATFPIGAGDGATQNLVLLPMDDPTNKVDETVALMIQNVTGPALLGVQTTHTVTITGDDNTAPDAMDDTYETVGNTRLQATAGVASAPVRHPNNVLANDTDADPGETAMLTCTPIVAGATTLGGTVDLSSNGDFMYNPPVGMTGMVDTFTYTVNDPNSGTDTATASITLTGLVYYVDAMATPGGDGRDSSCFNSLASVPSTPNSTIYVAQGTTPGNITLGNNQVLLGAGSNLEFNVNNTLMDPDVLFTATTRPTLSGTVTLASGNTLSAANWSTTGVPAIVGSSVGGLTISQATVTAAGARAVEIQGGVGVNVAFDAVNASGTTSGILLNGNTGSVNCGTTTLTSMTGTALAVTSNPATTTFTSLTVTSTGVCAQVSNSGTLTVSAGTITSSGGAATAVDIDNTNLAVTLTAVNSAGGTAPGVDLNTTTGTFAVLGGTISDKTGGDAMPPVSGVGIVLNDAAGVSLSGMTLQNFTNWGIYGETLSGFSMSSCMVTSTGSNGSATFNNEGSVYLRELTGTASITGSTISDGFENNLRIRNTTGVLNPLTISGCTFGHNDNIFGEDAVLILAEGTANVTTVVSGSMFSGARDGMLQVSPSGTATLSATISDNTFNDTHPSSGGSGVEITGTGSNIIYAITGTTPAAQTFVGCGQDAIHTNFSGGTITGTIQNNRIGTTGVASSGSALGDGIYAGADSTGVHNVTISGNEIRRVGGAAGISCYFTGSGNCSAILSNNTVAELEGFVNSAVWLELQSGTGVPCWQLDNNTFDASGATIGICAVYIDQSSGALSHHNFPSYAGSADGEFPSGCSAGTASTGLDTYLMGRGNTMTPPIAFPNVDATGVCGLTGNAGCP